MAYPGYPFTKVDEAVKLAVWQKGKISSSHNSVVYRLDMCGQWMQYDKHGDEGDYGWEIDHIKPRAKGGKTA